MPLLNIPKAGTPEFKKLLRIANPTAAAMRLDETNPAFAREHIQQLEIGLNRNLDKGIRRALGRFENFRRQKNIPPAQFAAEQRALQNLIKGEAEGTQQQFQRLADAGFLGREGISAFNSVAQAANKFVPNSLRAIGGAPPIEGTQGFIDRVTGDKRTAAFSTSTSRSPSVGDQVAAVKANLSSRNVASAGANTLGSRLLAAKRPPTGGVQQSRNVAGAGNTLGSRLLQARQQTQAPPAAPTSAPPVTPPATPQLGAEQPVNDLQAQLIALMTPTAQEQEIQRRIDQELTGLEQGLSAQEDAPIALPFITGRQASIERQSTLRTAPLQRELARLQSARQAQLGAIEAQLGFKEGELTRQFQAQQAQLGRDFTAEQNELSRQFQISQKESGSNKQLQFNPLTGQGVIFDKTTGETTGVLDSSGAIVPVGRPGSQYSQRSQYAPRTEAPPGGWRTDRHNNPGAIMYEGFNKMFDAIGYKEGVDYTMGDPFVDEQGNVDNSKHSIFFKDKETGIKAAIDLIDNYSFYTNEGAQRWEHTAMAPEQWEVLNDQQKRDVIKEIYKRERGSGIIFGEEFSAATEDDVRRMSARFGKDLKEQAVDVETWRQTGELPKGKGVNETTARAFADAKAAFDLMEGIKDIAQSTTGGPFSAGFSAEEGEGMLWGVLPHLRSTVGSFLETTGLPGGGLVTQQKIENAAIKTAQQVIGKYLEGGVLRKEDEVKYERILPKISDTVDLKKAKWNGMISMLRSKLSSDIDTFAAAGFDTSQFQALLDEVSKIQLIAGESEESAEDILRSEGIIQ